MISVVIDGSIVNDHQDTMVATASLLDLRPDQLAEKHDPAELHAELRSLRGRPLTAAQAETLDYALAHWVMQAVARPTDAEGVALLDTVCALASRRAAPEAEPHVPRWEAFRSLLENKRLAIEGQATGRAKRLLQYEPIRALLAERGPMKQIELAAELGISTARVSQVLAVIEEDGLVQRRRSGRDVWVELAQAALAPSAQVGNPAAALANPVFANPVRAAAISRCAAVFHLRPAA
jgi:DNA-binding MarR family transcriptional regulator